MHTGEANGRKAAVLWIGGLLLTGAVSGLGTWGFNYVREAHDAAIRAERNTEDLKAFESRLLRMEQWRVDISDLASKRGEIIPRLQRDIEDIRSELRTMRENRKMRTTIELPVQTVEPAAPRNDALVVVPK